MLIFDGLLRRVLKCSLHLLVMALFSFISAPLADRSGVIPGLDGPCRELMELKNFLEFLVLYGVLLDVKSLLPPPFVLHMTKCNLGLGSEAL